MNKNETHGFVNQLLIYTLVMICFSGSIGLGTVWMRQQMAQTANAIRNLENRTVALERRLAETNALVEEQKSHENLLRRNQEWNLALRAPAEAQINRVALNVEDRLARKRHDQLFAQEHPVVRPVRFVLGGGTE